MTKRGKQLSNAFATGGGGAHFEAHVQAAFVALMLTGGFSPCLPCWPISKIKLQGKFAGYNTDDLIVFVEQPGTHRGRKLLGQIKHSINITENDAVFGDVIQAAWSDFGNATLFSRDEDAIALITGPLSATDVNDVRMILEWARHAETAAEFIEKVELPRFSSKTKRAKLRAFRTNLGKANDGTPVSDDTLHAFLKHFHLLGYDLDIEAGVTLSLLHSLIGQSSPGSVGSLWARLVNEVQIANKNAGTISPETVGEDVLAELRPPAPEVMPNEFSAVQLVSTVPNWSQHPHAADVATANLLGAWDETLEADVEVVGEVAKQEYSSWIPTLRETLLQPHSPVSLRNGIWRVTERSGLWAALGERLFDDDLERFAHCVRIVLAERDPQFDLPADERYAASIHGKVLKHSKGLRKGVSETLALLGSRPGDLVNTTSHRPETLAAAVVRETLGGADWVLWASLDSLLSALAEAAPDEFLDAVENAMRLTPCPFDELFSQEDAGITGRNYMSGLLWALETLAWDEKHLVRVVVILGNLAVRDPGGNWSNRPGESLATILLPWLPQTMASIEKRKVAVQTLVKEVPGVAWSLLLNLLPNQHQTSSGAHKPSWRNTIPDSWEKGVTGQEYWAQVSSYADLAVSMAVRDFARLRQIIEHLDSLPQPSFDRVLDHLSSQAVLGAPEDKRLPLWDALTELVVKHRRYSGAKWALTPEVVSRLESVVALLAPKNPLNLHRRLFGGRDFELFEEAGGWKEQQRKLQEARQQAVAEILAYGSVDTVVQFAQTVESPSQVGWSLGLVAGADADSTILPALLGIESHGLAQFAGGYAWSRQSRDGWAWVDALDKSDWSIAQIGAFLAAMPFVAEAWARAAAWLGRNEVAYWSKSSANPYDTDGDLGPAVDKLIQHRRPYAAIDCLHKELQKKQSLDGSRSVKALISALTSPEPPQAMETYDIVEIIAALQEDANTDSDGLFQVEWAYLPLLDGHRGATPKLLHHRLGADPTFFCEVIRLVYRSRNSGELDRQPDEHERSVATNAWRLLYGWRTPPGTRPDGSFSRKEFKTWLKGVTEECAASGHLEVAQSHVGQVLFYAPRDPQGLWIDRAAADALNGQESEHMRRGFHSEAINSRGVHFVDPTGKPERELAETYRRKADDVENASYQRFAVTLRNLSVEFDREADRIVADNHGSDDDHG
jgi:hypothetical protein